MDQRPSSQTYFNFAEVAIRSSAAMIDMQIGIGRHIAGIQARSARLFGVPDYTHMLDASAEESRRLVTAATDQMLHATQRIGETMNELRGQMARVVEQQARTITEEMCRGIDRIGGDAEQALRTTSQQVSRCAQEAERVAAEARRNGNSTIVRAEESNESTKRKEFAK